MVLSLPIKSIEEINLIKNLYREKYQISDLLMFIIGINTGLDLLTLLNIKIKDIKNKNYISGVKQRFIPLSEEIQELVALVVKDRKLSDYLFCSQFGNKIARTYVFTTFKNVCLELGLSDKYSVASWRKTFAYHYYQKYKDISYLMWFFNQYSVNTALKFINVEENMNLRLREGVCL